MESADCLIDVDGKAYVKDDAGSYAELASPARLMAFAAEGRLPKQLLARLLTAESRPKYLEACAAIEKRYTLACRAENDPCLESGCTFDDEICLEPLLKGKVDYHKACAAEWMKLFEDPANRIDAWRS